ncbi:baseplate J/gp47 family protein [Leptotrichia sp. OH3620_COT-345]|uniref:baseplate J/gp47 family protein n=1 Tax=Leptotrichia sp. OH3620_COT-345 TaxID=2491048 RepID=UPI0013151D2B|nr:baseplate J/gp47 family protein [Leptotrichia sp. OH3620_COT-345]
MNLVTREEIEIKKDEINQLTDQIFKETMQNFENSVGSFPREIVRAFITELLIQNNLYDELSKKHHAETAKGIDLDKICEEDYIFRFPAVAATGTVKIYGIPGAIIQKGYQVASNKNLYEIQETKEIPSNGAIGNTTVLVKAVEAGSSGNVSIGEINSFAVSYQGLERVENEIAVTNGKDIETDEELYIRRKKILSRICANYNATMIEKMLLENFDILKKIKIVPRWNGKGTLKIVVTGKENNIIETADLNKIKLFLDNEIITDAEFTVNSVRDKKINITLEAILNREYDEESAINLTKKILNEAFLKGLFEENRIYYAEVIEKLLEVKAFKKISNIDINNTKEDIILTDEDLVSIGTVTIKSLD